MSAINCAVIDGSGNVVNVIVADPASFVIQNHTIQPIGSSGAGIGWTYSGGQFVAPAAPPVPTLSPAVAGTQAINQGIQITSIAFPTLNGTYALSQMTQISILGALSYCLTKNQFPGNASTLNFPDAAGNIHQFTTIAEFEAFSEAIASYLDPIFEYINTNGTAGSLPTSNAVTIA